MKEKLKPVPLVALLLLGAGVAYHLQSEQKPYKPQIAKIKKTPDIPIFNANTTGGVGSNGPLLM